MAVQTQIVPPTATSAPGTSLAGPIIGGPRAGARPDGTLGSNQGLCLCMQEVVLNHNGSSVVDATFYLPKHTVIVDVIVDSLTAWNSATSDTFSLGTSSGDTTYASGVDVKGGAARIRPTFSTTQLSAMQDTGTNETFVASVTPVGSASAGQTVATILYVQTINYQSN